MKEKKLSFLKKYSPLLFNVGLIGVSIYLTLRISSWLNLMLPFNALYLVAACFLVYGVIEFRFEQRHLIRDSKGIDLFMGTANFVVMYLAMAMIPLDLLQLVLRLFIKDAQTLNQIFLVCGWITAALVTGAVIAGVLHTKKIVVVKDTASCAKLKQNSRIVLLTDLHIGYFVGPKHIQKIVDAVNRLDADAVLISGDIINAGNTEECPQLDEVAVILSTMESRLGTFAVTGNHDPDASEPKFRRFLKKAQITLLDDETRTEENFHLVGRRTITKKRQPLQKLMEALPADRPVIVIDHDPLGIEEAKVQQADLVLCGHTHKGQVFPFNLVVRLLYKKNEVWGEAAEGKTTSIVSAGAGYFSMPMRIGSSCEVVSIDLKARP